MTDYSNAKICKVGDEDFQTLISELCHCARLSRDQFDNHSLSYLLMAIRREKIALTQQHLPVRGILTTKVDKLIPDSVVHNVCRELANAKRTHIESFDGKTVLTLIKAYNKGMFSSANKPSKPSKSREQYNQNISLIKRRRRNGDL